MWRPQTFLGLLALLCGVILWDRVPSLLSLAPDPISGTWLSRLCLVSATGAAYFALRTSLRHDCYHQLNFSVVLLYVGLLGFFTWSEFMPTRYLHFIYRSQVQDIQNINYLSAQAMLGENEDSRRKMARSAFVICGLTVAYKSDSGELLVYTPTLEDHRERVSLEEGNQKAKRAAEAFEGRLVEHPLLVTKGVLAVGGLFLLFFGADILWLVFLRPWTES